MFDDPKMKDAARRLSKALAAESPEAAEILEKLRTGYTSDVEALRQLMAIPGINALMEKLAESAFAPLREEDQPQLGTKGSPLDHAESLPATITAGELPTIGGPRPPVIVQETGLPRLNPLVEAAIAERAALDGDVPELRSGPLPEGGTPAVPVDTTARDPITVGAMLRAASDQVAAELQQAEQQYVEAAKQLKGAIEEEGLSDDLALQVYRDNLPAAPTGVPGYEAGQRPLARKVEAPTGSALARMPIEERQQAAYKALSTTQGRRSALTVLTELLLTGLASEGYEMQAQPPSVGANVLVHAEWSMDLSGPGATQPNFAFIDTAAKALLFKMVPLLRKAQITEGVLEVDTVDTADFRRVGWAARIVGKGVV